MKYLSVLETAKKWGISDRLVRRYCSDNRICGAKLVGKTWLIPDDATKPQTKRKRAPKTLLEILQEEKKHKVHGRIYHKLQIELTYSSNHIEGSQLSHEQTLLIFDTKTLGATNNSTRVDDIIETMNHFKCIDYVIDHAEYKLTESMIKELHRILKTNTSDSFLDWFKVGDYKLLPNEVGGLDTVKPSDVHEQMMTLLNEYNSKTSIKIEDIIDFHYKFEKIHPFQDGNGRVGRLIMFKECLKHHLVPILIMDEFKDFYYRGLKEYRLEQGYLIDTCLHGQDLVKIYLDHLDIKY